MVSLFSFLEDFTEVEKEKNQRAVKKTSEDKKLSLLSKLLMNLSRRTMEKLCFADQIRFNGISKRWLYLDKNRKAPSGSLPCFASVEKLQNGNLQCQFYESSDFNPFSVDKIDLGRFCIVADSLYCTCKFGWLFLSMINWCSTTSTSFLLYSSLTKDIIKLPTFVHSKSHQYSRFVSAFSSDPSLPDCVFLILHYDVDIDNRITISTCCQGDKEWTSREYDRGDINYMCFGSTPVYLGGSFYFVSSVGEVASYNVALGEWKAVRNLLNGITHCNTGYEAFELNGELGLVYFYDDELNGGYDDCEKLGYVRIFDQADKIWVRLESLGHQALYVSSNTFSISAVGEEARKNGVLPGKVYRTDRSGCVSVHSLVKGDLFKFSPCPGSRNREEVVDGKLGFWVEPRYQLQTESRYKKW